MRSDNLSCAKNKRILIVDDEEPMRELLQLFMKAEGYAANSSENGVDALGKLQVTKYDLMLLDLMMPMLDGMGICCSISAFTGTRL